MVVFNNQGRLGNFMFQCANCISYAKRHNLEFTVPVKSAYWPVYFQHLRNKMYKPMLPKIQVYEQGHQYQEIPFEEGWRNKNIVLNGYWQSEKYFKDYREDILKAFLPASLNDWTNKIWHRVGYIKHNTVAIHVRRTDYLSPEHLDKHPVCSIDYYHKAIYQFPATYKFIVFSDDIQWCKNVFVGDEYSFNTTTDPLKAMIEMACCQDFIVANSSFSWWASWLNHSPYKKVIMPKIWFGPANGHLVTHDIYPEGAIII